jgi:DUF438 domain-containing protein
MSKEYEIKFCDIHLTVFKESIEKDEIKVPSGHPINILMEEHKMLLGFAEKLREVLNNLSKIKKYNSNDESIKKLDHILKHFKDAESHYLREENVLFPYLEKHGVTEPPAIMWTEHDKIRGIEKEIFEKRENFEINDFHKSINQIREKAINLSEMLSNHFYKENKILFPTSLRVMEDKEWFEIRKEFDKMGYCCFTPTMDDFKIEEVKKLEAKEIITDKIVNFETGQLTFEEIEGIFNALPVEVTFVDDNDIVRYFIPSKDMVFLRTKAVIGNKVQNCHPQKSVHIVNKILDGFRSRERDVADFWIDFKGRLLYIRYLPVRNKDGKYLGCIEVTQDVSEIKKLEGEKRLLDWK